MLLGKRTRHHMKRTTSMPDIAVDPSCEVGDESPPPSDCPRGATANFTKVGVDGFDKRVLAIVSPGHHGRRPGDQFLESSEFLRACSLCHGRLLAGREIYMYRGDTAFCSAECRQQRMIEDEKKEKSMLASKKQIFFTTAPPTASS